VIISAYFFSFANTHRVDRLCFSERANFFHERTHKNEACETALLEEGAIALAPTSIEKIPVAE